MSCIPFDIQKSELDIAKLHSTKANKTCNYLIFSTSSNNISWKETFLEGKTSFGHLNVNIGPSSIDFPQIARIDDF
jgi:hypothetical protein